MNEKMIKIIEWIVKFAVIAGVIGLESTLACKDGSDDVTSEVMEEIEEVTNENTVSLQDVIAPTYNEVFAIAYVESDVFNIDWGVTEGYAVMIDESAYPGFGRPMLVIVDALGFVQEGSSVALTTNYGEYYYVVRSLEDVALVDGTSVVSAETKENIVNYYTAEEILYIYDKTSEICYSCEYQGGTEITL